MFCVPILGSVRCLAASPTPTHQMSVAPPPPSCYDQQWLQTLPSVSWGPVAPVGMLVNAGSAFQTWMGTAGIASQSQEALKGSSTTKSIFNTAKYMSEVQLKEKLPNRQGFPKEPAAWGNRSEIINRCDWQEGESESYLAQTDGKATAGRSRDRRTFSCLHLRDGLQHGKKKVTYL